MSLWSQNRKTVLFIIILIACSLPTILPLFHPGFFQSDDGEWMVIRFSAFHQAFRDGQFPVRFLGRLNYGYGYPVANFLYPGFMYLAEPIHLLGFGFVDTIKIILGFSMVGSALFAFLWLARLFDRYSALIGALVYLYTPYHLFDLYKRGSAGELLELAVVPFILWQLETRSFFWTCIGIALLILSHNTLAVLFLPIFIIYSLLSNGKFNRKYFYQYTSILVISLGLSAFFWIPAVSELQYTRFSETKISDVGDYFAMVNLIGLSSFIVLFVAFYKVQPWIRLNLEKNKLTLFFIILGLLSIIFSSKMSEALWYIFPSSFIQFPFRLLSYLIIAISFLAAYITFSFKKYNRYLISTILLVSLFISVLPYIKPSEFFDKGDSFYSTNEATTNVHDEYMPKWVKQKPTEHFENKVELVKGAGEIRNLFYNSKKVEFDAHLKSDSEVHFNIIYYPGWNAYVDGRQINIQYRSEKGIMVISLPKGEYTVNLEFSETPLRLFADILAIVSLMTVISVSLMKLGKLQA